MTNKEKALDYSIGASMYKCPTNGEYDTATYKAFLTACEWKDKQFKEYLEKKRDGITNYAQSMMQSSIYNEIINEFFKED